MRSGGRPRTELSKLGHPTGKDVVAGFVPVCSAFPKGWPRQHRWLNPVLGLYSGMAPTLAGAVFARTVLMTTTLTSAIALSSQSVLATAGLDPTDPGNIATLTLMVGIVMTLFGLFRLGSVTSFVSTSGSPARSIDPGLRAALRTEERHPGHGRPVRGGRGRRRGRRGWLAEQAAGSAPGDGTTEADGP